MSLEITETPLQELSKNDICYVYMMGDFKV